jgi:hypothetical protein
MSKMLVDYSARKPLPDDLRQAIEAALSSQFVFLHNNSKGTKSEWRIPEVILRRLFNDNVYITAMEYIEYMCHKYKLLLITYPDDETREYVLRFERT